MCGIAGKLFFHSIPEKSDQIDFDKALRTQSHRGPDFMQSKIFGNCILGHNRLSIIDLNPRSNQPMSDMSNRYTLCYNGEIYNYQDLKNQLLSEGITFQTSSDTEVILYHLIKNRQKGLEDLEGCFALALYDSQEKKLIISRDSKGINPLLYSISKDTSITFGSELQFFNSILDKKVIDKHALSQYFKYTYIPAPRTMLENVKKLMPGEILTIHNGQITTDKIRDKHWPIQTKKNFNDCKNELKPLLENAVINRLQADVPLGTFLSGGLDSSIVSAIAAQNKEELHTFSIGFEGNNYFDESVYSKMVAKHIGSIHHPIFLSETEISKDLKNVLNSFDEPFADSSAIAMYFLSKETKKIVTVSLSGDGADELFAGYNKHQAFTRSFESNIALNFASKAAKILPQGSRDSFISNKKRQLEKFSKLNNTSPNDRYDFLASFIDSETRKSLLKDEISWEVDFEGGLNEFLLKDQEFILPNDMLKKVDLMSMQHSLEVRVPFLDQSVIDFSNSLPEEFKLDGRNGKLILKETFKEMLPEQILKRSKKGFEVPLNTWLSSLWNNLVENHWFEKDFIESQGLFDFNTVTDLKKQLLSKNKGNSGTILWAYLVFQNWYDKTVRL